MSPAPKLRFLIADPLDGVQQFARKLLEGFGFAADHIRCCTTPEEALAIGADWAPDFLICDAFVRHQPDGPAVYEALHAQHPQLRLGLMSFEVTPELEARAKSLGARFVLKKPFAAETLRSTVQASLEWLHKERPELAARMAQESQGRLDARGGRRIELPPVVLPQAYKVGEVVQLDGARHKVMAVVIRHNEQLLQLEGVSQLVPAHRVKR